MKQLFLRLFYAIAIAEPATATAEPAKPAFVPASPKLNELKATKKAAWAEMLKHEDPETKEAKDASLAYFKSSNDVKAEEAELTKLENDRITQEKRNERLKMNANQLDAFRALITEQAKKSPDAAKVAELETAFNTAKELVDNELLAKYAGSSSAKKSGGNETADKSSGAAERDAKLWPLFADGKKDKEVETETGENRSNVWFSHDRYNKANQLGKYAAA